MTDIFHLLADSEACASHLGLSYGDMTSACYRRQKAGKGFFYAKHGQRVTDGKLLKYFKSLAIPPAWHDVTIALRKNAYILATGIDQEGRKQYLYHPQWFSGREMLQFYKLIYFGRSLPELRTWVREHLHHDDQDRTLAGMLLTLDKTAIRVGNQNYFDEHETVGLTTLRKEHVQITDAGVTFHFTGKSGQEIYTVSDDAELQRFYQEVLQGAKGFLFPEVDPAKINALIQDVTRQNFTAKDFRTWGGTVWAYEALVKEKATLLEAVDHAAEMLGNTRSVARTYYIHPHMLEAYEDEAYRPYFHQRQAAEGLLSQEEHNLLRLLKRLKKDKYDEHS